MESAFIRCINKTETVENRLFIFSQNTYKYLMQALFAQITTISLLFYLFKVAIKPFGGTPTVALISTGVAFSGFGQYVWFRNNFFPSLGVYQIQTLGLIGIMVYLFLVGVKLDVGIIKKSSRKAWIIGISTFVIPMTLTVPLASFLSYCNYEQTEHLLMVALLVSTTSFHVVNCFLTELKILSTELGRLATSISTISGTCSWITLTISFAVVQEYSHKEDKMRHGEFYFVLSTLFVVIFIAVVLRKYVIWVVKHTPNGETIKDIHVVVIFLMIFGTGFIGEVFGLHCLFGPMVLGLAIPDGKPVGSALTEKLEYPIMAILLPVYMLSVGIQTDKFYFEQFPTASRWTLLFSLLGSVGKFIGIIIPCLIYKIPIRDAAVLGLILSTIGIFDVANYSDGLVRLHITGVHFTAMVMYALGVAAITSPLVYWFYNPSMKYMVYKNRTIQNTKHNTEFRMLICIYNDENVPTIVNLLEASNPTRKSHISIYVLHIIELQGRSTPLLISHQPNDKLSTKSMPSEHIVNCFRIYEKQNQGAITVNSFTAMVPFVSAHDDICTLALDKKTSLIILPFHKQWSADGVIESSKCRNVNKKVLNKAPCSVGLLIDRKKLSHVSKSVVTCWSAYIVGVVFLGDADDREALCYAMRMAEHPNINLVVHRLVPVNITLHDMNEKILDDNSINEYRLHSSINDDNMYREEVVKDGIEIVSVIRAFESSYDLILVGRRQNNYSSLFLGLMEWNEYEELGFFGDMFASQDFKGNTPVLVIQQHSAV